MEPLHNEQHGNAGATTIVVVDDRTVEVHQPLMLRQRPDEKERGLGCNAQQAATWEGVTLRPCFRWTHGNGPRRRKRAKRMGSQTRTKNYGI